MRFSLADLKKTIVRRKGEPQLVPFLLRPGDLAAGLEALIALFEAHVGRERVYFPEDRPSELIGDYRLARCLGICLSEWYEWRAPAWPEGASDAEAAALAARGIASSSPLRLALYDHVNEIAGGFLGSGDRDRVMDNFAANLGLARSTLDDLLRLDAEPQAVLTRLADGPPTAVELAARYNQRAVETLLTNAATVEWIVAPDTADAPEGLGTVVKRICFLARRMGVQYEVAFASPLALMEGRERLGASGDSLPAGRGAEDEDTLPRVAEARAPYASHAASAPGAPPTDAAPAKSDEAATLDGIGQPLVITLFGPQELTGAPTQYGERLARLCRALLGYRRDAVRGRAALDGMELHGTASVYLHGRPISFSLDDRLLRLLAVPSARSAPLPLSGKGARGLAEDPYDSALERRLAEEFATLERERATAGWRLEREPEPILVGETILVPDFALRRGGRRIFLEIAGYWRPGYRERKRRKLGALSGGFPLILAVPDSARDEFAPLAGRFPLLWYRDYLSARALVELLERDFNDFAARLAALDGTQIRREVARRGRIPPAEAYTALRCYTRSELAAAVEWLAAAAESVVTAPPLWVEGIGLCTPTWRDDLLAGLSDMVARAPDRRLPLPALAQALHAMRPGLGDLAEAALEALALQAGLHVTRASLFEAQVTLDAPSPGERTLFAPGETPVPRNAKIGGPSAQPRRRAKRKESVPTDTATGLFAPSTPSESIMDGSADQITPPAASHPSGQSRGRDPE
jgi:predicted nuclease of restriction endonuclease-like RecB superfamily